MATAMAVARPILLQWLGLTAVRRGILWLHCAPGETCESALTLMFVLRIAWDTLATFGFCMSYAVAGLTELLVAVRIEEPAKQPHRQPGHGLCLFFLAVVIGSQCILVCATLLKLAHSSWGALGCVPVRCRSSTTAEPWRPSKAPFVASGATLDMLHCTS